MLQQIKLCYVTPRVNCLCRETLLRWVIAVFLASWAPAVFCGIQLSMTSSVGPWRRLSCPLCSNLAACWQLIVNAQMAWLCCPTAWAALRLGMPRGSLTQTVAPFRLLSTSKRTGSADGLPKELRVNCTRISAPTIYSHHLEWKPLNRRVLAVEKNNGQTGRPNSWQRTLPNVFCIPIMGNAAYVLGTLPEEDNII